MQLLRQSVQLPDCVTVLNEQRVEVHLRFVRAQLVIHITLSIQMSTAESCMPEKDCSPTQFQAYNLG